MVDDHVDNPLDLPIALSKDTADIIFYDAKLALEKLPTIANFHKFTTPLTELTDDEKDASHICERLAWALRIADSEQNSEVANTIQSSLHPYPDLEYFVVYNLMTTSYELADSLKTNQNIGLQSLSDACKKYSIDVLSRQLTTTQDPEDLELLRNLAARIDYGGETYVEKTDVEDLTKLVQQRQANNDKLFEQPAAADKMKEIERVVAHFNVPLQK